MVSTAVPASDVLCDQYFSQPILEQITAKILHQSSGRIAGSSVIQPGSTTALINKHSRSVTGVKCLHCAFLQMTQAVTFRLLVNEFAFSSGGGGCVWHGDGDRARDLGST